MTMPINGVTVYGKWILNEYRVFLHPKFSYTIQLRAEYAPKEVPTPTRLTWYDNFTANPVEDVNYYTDNNLQINKAVDIKAANTFTRDGYEFIGWTRVPTTKENNYAEGDGNETTITDTTYKTISDFYSVISAGSVAVQKISVPESGTITLVEPYLVTCDGVKVTSIKIRRITTSDKDGDGEISISEMTIQNLGNRSKAVYVAMSDVSTVPALYALAYVDMADVEKRKGFEGELVLTGDLWLNRTDANV